MDQNALSVQPVEPAPLRKLVIDRSRWQCGAHTKGLLTQLRNSAGRMCCLGFHSLALGYTEEEITGHWYPRSLADNGRKKDGLPVVPGTYGWDNNPFATQAARINDSTDIDDAERESRLVALFLEQGWELTFEGNYDGSNAEDEARVETLPQTQSVPTNPITPPVLGVQGGEQ